MYKKEIKCFVQMDYANIEITAAQCPFRNRK